MTIGGTELLVVLAIAIMLFGPKKLPEVARTLGHAMAEYHKAQREFEAEIKKTTSLIDKEVSSVTTAEPKGISPKTPQPVQSESIQKSMAPAKTSPQGSAPQNQTVKEIAKNLGIDAGNKTDIELLREISLKTKKKEASEA